MRKFSLVVAVASLAFFHAPAVRAQGMGGGMGGMGGMGGDMGSIDPEGDNAVPGRPEAPRPPKPLKRRQFDKLVTDMFRQADADRNGTVPLAELHAVVDSRREAAIRARFAVVDANRDGSVSPAEFMAWQKQMGSVASSDAQASGDRAGPIADAIAPSPEGEDEYALAALIEPLNGTVLARANANYDAGVSLEELLAYEGKRFDEADKDHDGELSPDELRPARGPGRVPGAGAGPGRGPAGPSAGGPPR